MDITGLSISIEVDMSGFLEAMEELTALIKTVADELMEVEKHASAMFSGVNQSSKEAVTGTDLFVESLEMLKDIVEIGWGNKITGIVGLVVDGVKLATDLKKYEDESNDSLKEGANDVNKLGEAYNNATKQVQKLSDARKDSNGGMEGQGGIKLPPGGIVVDGVTSSNTSGAPNGNSSSVDSLFEEQFKKNLAMVKSMMSTQNAVIKINADAVTATQGQYNVLNQNIKNTTNNMNVFKQSAQSAAEITKMLSGMAQQAIGEVGTALGKMATGQKNPMDGLISMLKNGVKKLGEYLIAIGFPMLAVPGMQAEGALYEMGGVALEAAAAAMGAIKMASGGIVSGSSFVNVGEYAGASHNPEVIAPLDKLKGYMGTQHQTHSFEIQGDKLVSILSRVDNNSSFALGGV